MPKISIFWFRRDLRLEDNAGLYQALKKGNAVLPVFIFDVHILNKLEDKKDARVDFIYTALQHLNMQLMEFGSSLKVFYSTPEKVFKELVREYSIETVYANHDYEPYARTRDENVSLLLKRNDVKFKTYKDQCIFEKEEVTKDDGKPYTIFTPYSRKWKAKLNDFYVKSYPNKKYFKNFIKLTPFVIPSIEEIGFRKSGLKFPSKTISKPIVTHYKEQRDFPALNGTSHLSVHLRFGTVSIRALAKQALLLNETWLNELIWRDFYMMILYHFPHVEKNSFKPAYDRIVWRNNETEFKAWCEGQTGFPIVDAGMRELNATGFMHNRVRMIVASFLVKDLLIDWRWGEAYFAQKLLDFDLSANNGGWQWAAGSGCDAAPYFRVFNPTEQIRKFDPGYKYIKKWVPEFNTKDYPKPMVDHAAARLRVLKVYKEALSENRQTGLF
ncbi:MAG: Deoxyribodipyrimidine photo-lyase [Bacteroidetes bacterium]|jgi:deoxyribodipyrimidine photo-lyase|nr:Deoxyribodipyrimidine photo-lyase [Bacteroidota bacterium]MDF2450907.1 Deoxyribodipyrimidine photo-lyase [Bacteroidota bacterium]